MQTNIMLTIYRLSVCFGLLIPVVARSCPEDDFCALRKNNPPDVCSGGKDTEAIKCNQERGDSLQVCKGDPAPNRVKEDRPYVILVSLDGYRWDYGSKCGSDSLQALAKEGASTPQGMIPSYPSLTFPNHYTIITGLYPEHHGIVANSFYEPACMKRYSYRDPNSNRDGRWYGGIPLWSLAQRQGMRSACLFWPGSEAKIAGERPAYFLRFDDMTSEQARIDQIIAWLHQPPDQRPHFITLYYSNVDHAGHDFGPDSVETCQAVRHVDGLMGNLWRGLQQIAKDMNLKVDLIVVSDHGMAKTQDDWINLDRYADLSDFVTEGALLYPLTQDAAEKAKKELGSGRYFATYRRSQVPPNLHYDENTRSGDPVVVASGPYELRTYPSRKQILAGDHGYDPQKMTDMRAIFYAVGPDIRPGVQLPPFENVNVYPLIATILGLEPCQVDGKLEVLENILVKQSK